MVVLSRRERMSQRLIAPSELPESRVDPSSENTTELTHDLCPRSVVRNLPVEVFQSFIVPSRLAVANKAPSGLKATLMTAPRWPCRTSRDSDEGTSQIRAAWSQLPVATV